MKSIPKLIRRFAAILVLGFLLIVIVNIGVLFLFTRDQIPSVSPYAAAEETGEALTKTATGYVLSEDMADELRKSNAWAFLLDEHTMQVTWHTENLPDWVPLSYTLADVSEFTIGYIGDCPTYVGRAEDGIVVLGYPNDSYWKEMWPSWDYQFIANAPQTALKVVAINVIVVLLIYMIANMKLLKSIRPITKGIQDLPEGEPVHLRETGLLSELAMNINRTSDRLQSQQYQLKKKEMARVNWIAGISHDIRTPLSMVMGYAGQLENDRSLTAEQQKRAAVIVRQSRRMKDLINDLNLASKLEYNMQPLKKKEENVIAIVRQVVVDFMNMDIDEKYPMVWMTEETVSSCLANVDKELLKRAVSNLIQNSRNHNEDGCSVYVSVRWEQENCVICVEDDGTGISDEQIERLNHTPHYMVCDTNTAEQRHGLGLLIVKQIMDVHKGKLLIGHSPYGGFSAELMLPAQGMI